MKHTLAEKWFYRINAIILGLLSLSCILPMIHIVAVSLSDNKAIDSGFISFWPKGFNLKSYGALIEGTNVIAAFRNSVLITVVGVCLSMLFTIMAAYPLSRRYFAGRRPVTLFMVFTMLFSGGLIPTFLTIKSLGLVDSYGAIWLLGLVSTYNMMIVRTYFQNIPEEVEESARMDGCGEIRLILQIILPLSMPVLATIGLFYGVHYWNAFMNVLIYINDANKINLMVMVQRMVQSQSMLQELNNLQPDDVQAITPESIKSAGIIVMVVPILAVYPFLQKYFVKGVMLGSVKG